MANVGGAQVAGVVACQIVVGTVHSEERRLEPLTVSKNHTN